LISSKAVKKLCHHPALIILLNIMCPQQHARGYVTVWNQNTLSPKKYFENKM